MNLTAIAIDDEAPALAVIEKHASKLPFLSLEATFTNPLDAIQWLQNNAVDLIFLDIEMPDMCGTDFMRMMSGLTATQFIFTTAYENYALEGFELQALDYLLKPILFTRFASACQRALRPQVPAAEEAKQDNSSLFVKDGHDWVRIDIDQILFLRSDGNLLFIHQFDQKVVTRMTMQHFLSLIPSSQFMRIHKSYVVAVSAIRKIERDQLILMNGQKIPLARSFRSAITQYLLESDPLSGDLS